MVSMKQIANTCGVSVATVSKALNDYSDIGAETKEMIRKKADEMGYFPNSSARALKTNKTYNLGVLFIDEAMSGLTHDYFNHVLDSFKVTAESLGYDMTFISGNVTKRKTTYYEHCKYRGMDGVVIACVDFYGKDVQELIYSELPVVTIDHTFNNRISVTSDNIGGMRQLVDYAVGKMGHCKVAYIHGEDTSVTKNRLSAFYSMMDHYGISVPEEYVIPSMYRSPNAVGKATKQLLELPVPPTCIFCPDDLASIGCYNVLTEKGLKIPEDISVVGYDGSTISRVLNPKLTTMIQDTEAIGRIAAEQLVSLIEKPKTTIIDRIMVPARLYEGHSVLKNEI